jgi:hypothetical protein
MTPNEIIVLVTNLTRSEINIILQEKTNWGRNDLKMRLEQLYTNIAMKAIVELDRKK